MNRRKLTSILQIAAEIAALAVFIMLLKNNRLQMWFLIFGVSALLSAFLGRFYCSWICPMNTGFKLIRVLYSKIGIKRIKKPGFLRNRAVRIIVLVLFIGSMIVTKRLGLKINILLYITVFAVFMTLFFEENLWHRHLCPFGTILSVPARLSRYRMEIDGEGCISCGKCQTVCPADSIVTLENSKRKNLKHECLLCGRCAEICPKDVCKFGI